MMAKMQRGSHHSLVSKILFSKPSRKSLILFLLLSSTLLTLCSPLLQRFFVDTLLGKAPLPGYSASIFLWASFACLILSQIFSVSGTYVANLEMIRLQEELSEELYSKTLHAKSYQLTGKTAGEMVSLFATDVSGAMALIELSLTTGATIFLPIFIAPFILYKFYHISPVLYLGFVGGLLLLDFILSRRQARFFFNFKKLAAERLGFVNEWIQNMRALKILGWIPGMEKRIKSKREEETYNRVAMVTNGQVMASLGASVGFLFNIVSVWVFAKSSEHSMSPGELLSLFWMMSVVLGRPFRQIPWVFTFTADATTSVRRLERYFSELELRAEQGRIDIIGSSGSRAALSVKNLNVEISGRNILKNISLEISVGSFVAIVGPVGSGKSVLFQALLGEMPMTAQCLSAEGRDYTSVSAKEWRKFFAWVPQDAFVANSTLKGNVALQYSLGNHGDGEILTSLEAAEFSFLEDKVSLGLESEIGERGVNLSGGQRQRVNLARADYFNRDIVLLDDSLSAVDVAVENSLIENLLKGRWAKKTRLLITHRLSVLPHTNWIVEIDQGQILRQGTYKELYPHG